MSSASAYNCLILPAHCSPPVPEFELSECMWTGLHVYYTSPFYCKLALTPRPKCLKCVQTQILETLSISPHAVCLWASYGPEHRGVCECLRLCFCLNLRYVVNGVQSCSNTTLLDVNGQRVVHWLDDSPQKILRMLKPTYNKLWTNLLSVNSHADGVCAWPIVRTSTTAQVHPNTIAQLQMPILADEWKWMHWNLWSFLW